MGNKMGRKKSTYLNLARKVKSPPMMQVIIGGNQKNKKNSSLLKDDSLQPVLEKQFEDKKNLGKAMKHLNKMSNDELEALLNTKDNFVLDCLLDQSPLIQELKREHGELRRQVSDLANFNRAREPEFVRDRNKLRETLEEASIIRRRVAGRHVQPLLERMSKVQSKLSAEAREFEEQSETLAEQFLNGSKNFDEFIEEYQKLRKETSKKRTLADRMAKEINSLNERLPKPMDSNSPIPTPRQRKRVSLQSTNNNSSNN